MTTKKLTAAQIEDRVNHAMDKADRLLATGRLDCFAYVAICDAVHDWAARAFRNWSISMLRA